MPKCPHCKNTHINTMEQTLCPMRPEQMPHMIEQFGALASDSDFRVTDRIRYASENGKERIGVVLWVVAPGASGTLSREPSDKPQYIVEPFDVSIPFGFADGYEVVSEEKASHVLPR